MVSIYGLRLTRESQNADDICGSGHKNTDICGLAWIAMSVYGGSWAFSVKSGVDIWRQVDPKISKR